ncbi:HsdM family class I SAM-dependent methyltransferase [Algoriella sp.]|uniref:HsdM family class I SAM-dependent methyltransferase n=1 Tax=Algoriella sp. TaxID=1872434 RepID=UPI002FCA28CA
MVELNILEFLDLGRAKSVYSDSEKLSDSEAVILSEVKEKDFGVDLVYFNTDEETNNSFPAVFLKKVNNFNDVEILKNITETQRRIWNYKKVLFLYTYSETEIRIYNCSEKPLIETKENFDYQKGLQGIEIKTYQYSDKEQLQELNKLFSRIAIDTGIIWTLEDAQFVRNKINLQKRVDKYLVESLVNTANQLENQGLEIDFIHKIILRSLFLLYLEDRGATDKNLYSTYKEGASSYFDILDDVEATYKLYERLEDDFNGNVFTIEDNETVKAEQLKIIKKCFTSGNDNTPQTKLFEDWRLFNFSIIQIELLSEIYENFLFKTDPELKKQTGTYYTPPALVEFILNEKLSTNNGENNYNVKILDPSCGSGIFLVESFKRLVKRYENQHKEKLNDFEKLKKLLTDNIFGIELHPQAIKVAAFSLYLALVDCLDPKNLWQKKKHRLPNLINNPHDTSLKAQGRNLFCRDTIAQNKEIESIEFNLVVGNPPFGTSDLLESVRNYCDTEGFAKEMVLPFLHKATEFAPYGEIALIFNTKVLTNTGGTYQKFRKWLFNDCYVEKIFNFSILRNAKKNFGGQLFGDATGPISIVFYKKEQPKYPSNKIAYYAPKTFIKSNVIEGLSIDFTDLKFLPREECQNPDTKIWKIAMWGGMNDWELIRRLTKNHISFKDYLIENQIEYGSGLHPKENDKNKIQVDGYHIDTRKIESYYTSKENTERVNGEFRRNNLQLFKHPLVVIKEGITNKHIVSSYFDFDVFYNKAVYGFSTNDANKLKSIAVLFNSNLSTYFFFLTSSSWGVERDRIVLTEYLNFPYSELDTNSLKQINFAELNFERTPSLLNQEQNQFNFLYWENTIKKLYDISDNDIIRISDTISLSIDLFHKQEKSVALYPVQQEQTKAYGKIISTELNDFLESQNLFASATIFESINRNSPLMMIKLSFTEKQEELIISKEFIDDELKEIDKSLWEKKSQNIYFRKKLNYSIGNDIYIIRPNQQRFWSQSMALEDASELILEMLNGVHDEV